MKDVRLKELAAQFRRSDLPFILYNEQRYEDVLIRQYNDRAHEFPLLSGVAAGSIGQLTMMRQLREMLLYEHQDQFQMVSCCTAQFKFSLLQLIQAGEADFQGNALLMLVDAFQLLIDTFQRNVHDKLLHDAWVLEEKCGSADPFVTSEGIEALIVLMATYTDELQRFYDEMDTVLYSDGGMLSREVDKVRLDEQLVVLLIVAERSIIMEECLQIWLASWKEEVANREIQQLLN